MKNPLFYNVRHLQNLWRTRQSASLQCKSQFFLIFGGPRSVVAVFGGGIASASCIRHLKGDTYEQ